MQSWVYKQGGGKRPESSNEEKEKHLTYLHTATRREKQIAAERGRGEGHQFFSSGGEVMGIQKYKKSSSKRLRT